MHRRGIEPPLNPSPSFGRLLWYNSPGHAPESGSEQKFGFWFPTRRIPLKRHPRTIKWSAFNIQEAGDIYNGFLYPPERQSVVNVYVPLPSDRDERKREPEPHVSDAFRSESSPVGIIEGIKRLAKDGGDSRLWHKLRVAGARSGTVAWIMECAPLDPFALLPGLLSDVDNSWPELSDPSRRGAVVPVQFQARQSGAYRR
ncbi:hypothetical protein DFH06DRAFT_1144315 [Mycena polygramma]|nr:hypothetical protein DFH06DRAFT_1144315 [Mycena polygramma]